MVLTARLISLVSTAESWRRKCIMPSYKTAVAMEIELADNRNQTAQVKGLASQEERCTYLIYLTMITLSKVGP